MDEMKPDMLASLLRQHLDMSEMFQQKREFSTAKQFRALAGNYAAEMKRRGLVLPQEASRLVPVTQSDIDRAKQDIDRTAVERRKCHEEIDREQSDGWDDPDR
jgi:hypothetical protein